MDNTRAERLAKKYSGGSVDAKKEMRIGRGPMGPGAMAAKGKPKNLKLTVFRLFRYLAKERARIILAVACALCFTVATLASSYMLRPIINNFIGAGDLPHWGFVPWRRSMRSGY